MDHGSSWVSVGFFLGFAQRALQKIRGPLPHNITVYDIQYITNVKKLEVPEEKLEVLLGPLI